MSQARRLLGLCSGLLGGGLLLWSACRQTPSSSPARTAHYVGDSVCASCHEEIASHYQQTNKARALYPLTPDRVVEDFSGRQAIYEPRTGFYYRAFREGDGFFQEEYRLDEQGRPIHRLRYPIEYVVGSGNAARTYLYEENGFLFELPLTWYTQEGRWALSPGYERANARFFRPIPNACLGCHTGHFEPVAETANRYRSFSYGITCERCHGPGSEHVTRHRQGPYRPGAPDPTIVNPARLSRERRMDLCQQCHLESTVAFYREGKGPLDYRPGERLSDYWLVFVHPGSARHTVQVASHVERMQQSACFQGSSPPMDCLTCHDPHRPAREQGPAHFNRICRSCHEPARLSGTLPEAAHTPESNCISCHMPRIRPSAVPHAAFTDHAIPRRLLPPPTPSGKEASESVHLEPIFPELRRERDYLLYEGIAYLAYAREHPNSGALQQALGKLEKGLKRNPEHAEGWYLLGYAYEWQRDYSRARSAYSRAVALQPTVERLLALARMDEWAGALDQAEVHYRQALQRQPEHPEALTNLGRILEVRGRLEEARSCYERAVALRPGLAEARFNLGTLLMRIGDLSAAEQELRQAIQLDPDYPKARNNLAILLARTGRIREAISHWEAAVEGDSTYADGLFNLAIAYAQLGRLREARHRAEALQRLYPRDARLEQLRPLLGASSPDPRPR